MQSTTGQYRIRIILSCGLCVLPLTVATPSAADDVAARAMQPPTYERIQLAQGRQCEQRMGPFVTQETAWQRWRQARGQGQAVSQGVVPCYSGDIRGYCFFVFRPC